MWWSRQPDAKDLLIQSLRGEVEYLRNQHSTDGQRIDRLTEAIARKANVDLIMPLPDPPPVERVTLPNPWKDPNPVTSQFKETRQ
jgi:hypothetical protein